MSLRLVLALDQERSSGPTAAPTNTLQPTIRIGGLPNGTDIFPFQPIQYSKSGDSLTFCCNPQTWTGTPAFTYNWQFVAGAFGSPPLPSDVGWANVPLITQIIDTFVVAITNAWYRCRVTGTNGLGNLTVNTNSIFYLIP